MSTELQDGAWIEITYQHENKKEGNGLLWKTGISFVKSNLDLVYKASRYVSKQNNSAGYNHLW